jgi:hypothetical protein
MAALVFEPTALGITIRTSGGAFSPPSARAVTGVHREQVTRQVTVHGANATLFQQVGVPWLTIPANCLDGVPFDIVVDTSALQPAAGDLVETIQATAGGFDPGTMQVTVAVRPEGPLP